MEVHPQQVLDISYYEKYWEVGRWWLRSPGNNDNNAANVNNNGGVNSNGNNVNNDNNAVRPAWPYRPMFVPCGASLCKPENGLLA